MNSKLVRSALPASSVRAGGTRYVSGASFDKNGRLKGGGGGRANGGSYVH